MPDHHVVVQCNLKSISDRLELTGHFDVFPRRLRITRRVSATIGGLGLPNFGGGND